METDATEAIRIAHSLRTTLRPGRLERVRRHISALDDRQREAQGDPRAVAALPCCLLADHQCTAYTVRPIACRAWNSSDAERCRDDLLGIERVAVPVDRVPLALQAVVSAGTEEALTVLGVATDVLALTPALRIALDSPHVAERWLAGEPVFAAARSLSGSPG